MLKSTYLKQKRSLKKRIREAIADLEALEKEPIEENKGQKRVIVPQWCKPPWERRDGRQHVVYCEAKRKRDKEAVRAWWIFYNGEAKFKSDCYEKAVEFARMRFCFETAIWNYEDWELYKAKNPSIEAKLKEIELKRSETVS